MTATLSLVPQSTALIPRLTVEKENDRIENVKKYSTFDYKTGTTWLAFRDLSSLFKQFVPGGNGIDYGCGSGRSTRFLSSLGLNPVGVDISDAMLSQAKSIDKSQGQSHHYEKINSGQIPISDKTCDFVFSSFVFLVIPSKEEMSVIVKDMHRVLKDKGAVIIATGSEKMHAPTMKWVSYETDFEENRTLESGSIAKVKIKEVGAEFYDFNWLDEDYQEVFKKNQFVVAEKLSPLGKPEDEFPWKDELLHSPYYIYVLKKQLT